MMNRYLAGVLGKDVIVMNPPHKMTPDEALEFAAFLVLMAEHNATKKFEDVLKECQS